MFFPAEIHISINFSIMRSVCPDAIAETTSLVTLVVSLATCKICIIVCGFVV